MNKKFYVMKDPSPVFERDQDIEEDRGIGEVCSRRKRGL